MRDDQGWRPLGLPTRPAVPLPTTGFTRLARVHALGAAGDAMLATALAGSLFFSIPTAEARGKVFLYLIITMAPFAIVSPLIGPLLDRMPGGRRAMVIMSSIARGVVAFLMIANLQTLWLFPLAFTMLVLQKGYSVARSSLVPTTVSDDNELVLANSKLALISGIMGFAGGAPGVLLQWLGSAEWSLAAAVVTYIALTAMALQLPQATVAFAQESAAERQELQATSIRLAASGMGLLRAMAGFLTILLAFELRGNDRPLWEYGVVGAASILGSLTGALIAPRIRRVALEERILIGALAATFVAAFVAAAFLDGVAAAAELAYVLGTCAAGGKLAFDSIVQRDAPDANRGRSFARFEARFQVLWVVGAAIAVAEMPVEAGYVAIVAVSGFAAFSYAVGLLAARQRSGQEVTPATAAAVEIEARMNEMSSEAKRRLGSAARGAAKRVRRGGRGRRSGEA